MNENGQFIGQILANFYLKFYPKDPKNKNKKDFQEPEHLRLVKQFKKIIKVEHHDINLSVSLLGIRNLIKKGNNPQITLKLTNNDLEENIIKIPSDEELKEKAENPMPGNNGPIATNNPTFQKKVTFKNINLTAEPLLWPFL